MPRTIACRKCGEEKEYYIKGMCKSCYQREWRKENPDYRKQYYQKNRDKILAQQREYHQKDQLSRKPYKPQCSWSVEGKEKLIEHYSITPWNQLLGLFPGRTKSAIRGMAFKLGITGKRCQWTETEEGTLVSLYPKEPRENLLEKLPRRTWNAIKYRAQKLGMKRQLGLANSKTVNNGKKAECKTAKFLWDNYQIVAFPSPESIYDLLLINGIKLEVKSKKVSDWKIGLRQSETDHFCDFLILWTDDRAFIVPYQEWANGLGHKRSITPKQVIQYENRWDLIVAEIVEEPHFHNRRK